LPLVARDKKSDECLPDPSPTCAAARKLFGNKSSTRNRRVFALADERV
jgi:hypothetical protein